MTLLSRLTRHSRARAIAWTFVIWGALLFVGIGEQHKARRLAVDPIVSATIRKIWLLHQKGGPNLFAHLVFDRKGPDGKTVHCDVPDVNVDGSGRKLSAGDTIMIAPQPDECWEPDIICETCAPWTPRGIEMMFVVSRFPDCFAFFLFGEPYRICDATARRTRTSLDRSED